MKKLILFFGIICLSFSAKAQEERPFKSISTFAGDTIAYMRYNFIENKQRYIGQKLEKFIEDYELAYENTVPIPDEGGVIDGVIITPWRAIGSHPRWDRGDSTAMFEITFREPLVLERNPRIQKIRWGSIQLENDYWLVAMKMKDAVIGDIILKTRKK